MQPVGHYCFSLQNKHQSLHIARVLIVKFCVHTHTMGVKELWRKALGDFRNEDVTMIDKLKDESVVVDTSAWVHKLDGIFEVAYARTSVPIYPHIVLLLNTRLGPTIGIGH